jgi:hypothetical protein
LLAEEKEIGNKINFLGNIRETVCRETKVCIYIEVDYKETYYDRWP